MLCCNGVNSFLSTFNASKGFPSSSSSRYFCSNIRNFISYTQRRIIKFESLEHYHYSFHGNETSSAQFKKIENLQIKLAVHRLTKLWAHSNLLQPKMHNNNNISTVFQNYQTRTIVPLSILLLKRVVEISQLQDDLNDSQTLSSTNRLFD
jgi:hypothetical protein